MNAISLKVVTPDRLFYSGMAEYVEIETVDGKMGFMCGALPQVVALCPGKIVIKTSVLETEIINGEGMVVVDSDGMTVISESCSFVDAGAAVDTVAEEPDINVSIDTAKVKIASSVRGAKSRKNRI